MSDIDKAWDLLWEFESKKYTNNPADPGGETKFGISKRAYPDLDIKNLTEEGAKEIYKRDYWDRMKCDQLPYPANIIVFDTAVNLGVSRTSELWKRAGEFYVNLGIASSMLLLRTAYYTKLADKRQDLRQFLRGWLNRVVRLTELEGKDA